VLQTQLNYRQLNLQTQNVPRKLFVCSLDPQN